MDNIAGFNLFQAVGPNMPEPKAKKPLPFPLETIIEDIAEVYADLDKIRKRIEVTKRSNVRNLTSARQKKLAACQYKVNTAMSLLRGLSKDLDTLFI